MCWTGSTRRAALVALATSAVACAAAGICASAEARDIYTLAGGGWKGPPRPGRPPSLATQVAFGVSELKVAALPGGGLMLKKQDSEEEDSTYWLLGSDGELRPIRRPRGGLPITADGAGNTYHVDSRGVGRRSRGGTYDVIAAGYQPNDLAAAADGTLFAVEASTHTVVRIEPDGSRTHIAGTGRAGFSGDGGPADSASLRSPYSVEVARDSSLLIADTGNRRIRRIGNGGTISTVAGNGRSGRSGDRGPATAARLTAPLDIVLGPHGGFAFLELDRVRRVTRGGQIGTLVASPKYGRELGRGAALFNGDGGHGKKAATFLEGELAGNGGLAPTEEGGYAMADDELIRYIPAARRPRLAMAIRTVVPERRRVSYAVTSRARLRLLVEGHGRRVVRRRVVGPGDGYFRLPRSLPRGGYRVQLTAATSDGQRTAREAAFLMMPSLSTRAARGAMLAFENERALITPGGLDTRPRFSDDAVPTRCRRFGPRRLDCVMAINVAPITGCEGTYSVRLRRHGQVYLREYGCEFRRSLFRTEDWGRIQLLPPGPDDY